MERVTDSVKTHELGASIGRARDVSSSASSLPPALQLQQQAGNQAVQHLLRSGYIQAKLAVSSPDDPEEREADNVANAIMRKHAGAPCTCSESEEMCEECRQSQSQLTIHRRATASAAPTHVPRIVSDVLRSPGHPLDAATRAFFEPRFGRDFSDVRVHTDAHASESAHAINAHAYTAGSDIVFNSGQYSPDTGAGRTLLAHELTHVVQQDGASGRIQRYSVDDFKKDASNVLSGIKSGVEDRASSLASLAGDAVSTIGSSARSVADQLEDDAIGAALTSAAVTARLLGGTVKLSGTTIIITIPDYQIAEIEQDTRVIPLGIPTKTIFDRNFTFGEWTVGAWAGQIIGDPEISYAVGPVVLRDIQLMLDPFAKKYSGTASIYVGGAVVGSGEKSDEVSLTAEGILEIGEVPIPIIASADAGFRTILRLVGKAGLTASVNLEYDSGRFQLDFDRDIQLGVSANLDDEFFLRVELESEEVCSKVWPVRAHQLGEAGVHIRIPFSLEKGPGGLKAKSEKPTFTKLSPDAIPSVLQNDRVPDHCMGIKELADLLCRKKKLPASICSVLTAGPGGAGGPGPLGFGPVPSGPSTGPRPPIVLYLPDVKAADMPAYSRRLGDLQHRPGRPRETGQLTRWRALMPGRIPASVSARAAAMGLTPRDVILPFWSRSAVLPERMEVDHIIEMQVTPIGREGSFDNMANYRLMDASSNGRAGSQLGHNIRIMREALEGATGDPSWITRDITFESIGTAGIATPATWTQAEMIAGDHVDAYDRLGRPPAP